MRWLKDVFHLFYPHFCCGCNEPLQNDSEVLCEMCLLNLSFIPEIRNENSEIKRRLYGKLKIEHGISTFLFSKNSIAQKLLHDLKYKKQEHISEFLAILTLQHLQNHEIFKWTDYIVPIPLHPSKEKERGYNQLDGFGNHLSRKLNIPYLKDYLIKLESSKTQTKKDIILRASKDSLFSLNPKYTAVQNQNILLIDDVITTGSTLESAGNCILKNSTNKISILTMAYTR